MTPAGAFSPLRLMWARRRRGIGQVELADSVQISVRAIKFYEAGAFAPAREPLRRIARLLRFPERFFLRDPIGDLDPEAASFRSRTKLSARQRDTALGSAAVAMAFTAEIERLYALPEPDFPDLDHRKSPEQTAEFVRRKWCLDEQPIESMMQLLESKGVRVFSLPGDAVDSGTFSLWRRKQPFVFLDVTKPQIERRLDLAHELGHLVLHRHEAPAGPKAQQVASAFASALLMPAAAIRVDAPSSPVIAQLVHLTQKWGVPVTAIVHRLHSLGILSKWQYRKLRLEIAEQPSLSAKEAFDGRERPLLLQRVFASMRARGVTKHKIASTVHIYPKDLDELVFGLAAAGLDAPADVRVSLQRLPPRLTLVSSTK